MKKLKILSIGLLAAAAVALLAPSARAQSTITYTTGDLLLGFEDYVNGSATGNDYIVDLGQANIILGLTGTTNLNTYLGLGNIGADLSGSSGFGSNWAATGSAGNNVQWGIVGATPKLSGTFGLPANTLFLTQAETTVGTLSTPPTEHSNSSQESTNGQIVNLASAFNGLTSSTNSNFGAFETVASTNSWSSKNPSTNAFGLGYGIEQPTSGTYIGPTNSVLDFYELKPVNNGAATYEGSFSLNSSGDLTYIAAVPEPSAFAAIGVGAAFLLSFRRHRKSVIA